MILLDETFEFNPKFHFNYTGLPSHPGHKIALEQWSGVGGMMSFYIKGNDDTGTLFLKSLKLFSTGLSYGGYESLAEIP